MGWGGGQPIIMAHALTVCPLFSDLNQSYSPLLFLLILFLFCCCCCCFFFWKILTFTCFIQKGTKILSAIFKCFLCVCYITLSPIVCSVTFSSFLPTNCQGQIKGGALGSPWCGPPYFCRDQAFLLCVSTQALLHHFFFLKIICTHY